MRAMSEKLALSSQTYVVYRVTHQVDFLWILDKEEQSEILFLLTTGNQDRMWIELRLGAVIHKGIEYS